MDNPCENDTKFNSTNSILNTTFCINEKNSSSIVTGNVTLPIIITINTIIGCVGIIGNLSVIIVFGKERKFRRKIPNIFIINQVSFLLYFLASND